MGDDTNSGEATWDIDEFHQWLRSVADSEGTTEEEVLSRMMSSYWVLDELEDLMDEREMATPDEEPAATQANRPPESDTDDPSTARDDPDTDGGEDGFGGGLEQLLTAIDAIRAGSSQSQESVQQDYTDRQLDRLQDEVSRLASRMDRIVDRPPSQQTHQSEPQLDRDALRDELQDELHDSLQQEMQAELESTLTEFSNGLEALEDRLSEVESDQATLQSSVQSDFEHVEEILKYLVNHTNEFDSQIDTIQAQLSDLRSQINADNDIARLKDAANRHGVGSAKCESCEKTVDIRLLSTPSCPHCGSRFDGVSPKDGWFGSNQLTTTQHGGRRQSDRHRAGSNSTQRRTQDDITVGNAQKEGHSSEESADQGNNPGTEFTDLADPEEGSPFHPETEASEPSRAPDDEMSADSATDDDDGVDGGFTWFEE